MIFVRAPFRISLGGGGTDLPSYYTKFSGYLISVAINKYMYVSVNRPMVDSLIRLKYTETEVVDNVQKIKHDLVREALISTNVTHSIEINSLADLPAGTGMGSSGSYLVALLKALHTFNRNSISAHDLAEEACKIEIDKLNKPVGKQDQYLAAFGGLTKLKISKKGKVTVSSPPIQPATLRDLENSFTIFYTGINREGKNILKGQDSATKKNQKQVLENLHLIKKIGKDIEKNLITGDVAEIGKLMNQHWLAKRQLSKSISSSKIDSLYKLGIKNGALGGKIIGAGGGGFLLFSCPGDKKRLREAMQKAGLREMFFQFDMEGAKVIANI
jgi:D-glycero-alpha-D-manno-heptose-7-phosphate kinase